MSSVESNDTTQPNGHAPIHLEDPSQVDNDYQPRIPENWMEPNRHQTVTLTHIHDLVKDALSDPRENLLISVRSDPPASMKNMVGHELDPLLLRILCSETHGLGITATGAYLLLAHTYSISIEELYETVTEFWTRSGTIEPPNPTNLDPPPQLSVNAETFDPSDIIGHFGLQSSYRHSSDVAKLICFMLYARANQTSAGGPLQYHAGSTSWHLDRTFDPVTFHVRFEKTMDAISQGIVQAALDIAVPARRTRKSLVTHTEDIWNFGTLTHQDTPDVIVSDDGNEEHEILFVPTDNDENWRDQDVFEMAFHPMVFERSSEWKQDKQEQPLSYVPVLRGDITESDEVMTPPKISPAPQISNVPPPTPTNVRSNGPPPSTPQGRRTDDRSPLTELPLSTLQGSHNAGRSSSPRLQGRRTDGQPRFWASPLPRWQMFVRHGRHHCTRPWDPGKPSSPTMQ